MNLSSTFSKLDSRPHFNSFFIFIGTLSYIKTEDVVEVGLILTDFFLLVNCMPLRRSCCLQCGTLRDMVSVTIWRLHGRSNVCECMLPFFSTFMSFLSICMSYHGIRMGLSIVKRLYAIQTGKH